MDINKHKFYMLQLLKDIFSNPVLASCLGFKGGTSMMFFHGLNRFSTDLDFDILDVSKEDIVYNTIKEIILKYGKIYDEAKKYYGLIIVLDYGIGERKLKIEINNRQYPNHYEILNYLGVQMRVMRVEDMFAHKLCALTDRNEITARDVFDCWFFLNSHTSVNKEIVELRMKMEFSDYIQKCIKSVNAITDNNLMSGLGELMDGTIKNFVKNGLKNELISLLTIFKEFPVFIKY